MATWISCSRWLQEKWGFQDIPSCHQFGDVFETAHFQGSLMGDIYKVSFSSLNPKILRFLLSYAPSARAQRLYGPNLEQVSQLHFCAHNFASEMQTPLGNSRQFLYPEIISGHRAAQLQPALCALHNTVTFSESGKIYSAINCFSILNHSRDSLLKRGP